MTMYDSTDAAAIPEGATIVAGYIDGKYQSADALKARFPDAELVTITVLGAAGARVADVETGDLTPADGAAWAAHELHEGRRPTLYCNASTLQQVLNSLHLAGVEQANVDFWVAEWTYASHLYPGSVATQWANPPRSGGDFDISDTNGTWPGTTPAPGPTPAPTPAPEPTGEFMPPTVQKGSVSGAVRNVQRLCNVHGRNLAIDGDFGPATEAAVKDFQTICRLTVDGIVGAQTWSALDALG